MCNPSKGQIKKPYGSSGTLYTPQFPIPYPDDTTCIWTITAPVGKRVKLMFEKFSLPQTPYFLEEPHADGEYCGYEKSMGADLVEIRDGPWPDSKLLGIYCGYKMPFDVYSTGRYLWVKFRSISDGKTSRGIKAPFEAVDPSKLAFFFYGSFQFTYRSDLSQLSIITNVCVIVPMRTKRKNKQTTKSAVTRDWFSFAGCLVSKKMARVFWSNS